MVELAVMGPGKCCSLPCKRGFWSVLAFQPYCSLTSTVAALNKVIINHASVINPKILHTPISVHNEGRQNHLFDAEMN